ncbi:hypothetical protein L249_3620 [Ophiocordyceps polyrhachis-furcata BCC 54312]|uniref:RING-type E3 ubiquitin transferase n=1 Tax=Ophiocordyceps polyrhachis-furcata BCC 54312 TaxID=1330021 RepID=A0A367LMD5_9HYPO|nr:hypothetical protein L249_3620 [Ophiocordyceps polyrhachis-furcata BCC 54312]
MASSSSTSSSSSPSPSQSPPPPPYPFASAPDIVRSHQKDSYFSGQVSNRLTDLWRLTRGARAAHARGPELRCLGALLYLGLTTVPGNRTLGEEYCDLVQVEARSGRLPDLGKRTAYVVGVVLVPYLGARMVPSFRAWLRSVVESRLAKLSDEVVEEEEEEEEDDDDTATKTETKTKTKTKKNGFDRRILDYLARHLSTLTSTAPLQALILTLFYFQGSYYELSKRLLSLRYVFVRSVPDTPDRAGYEVLGVLLAIQLAVQSYLHLRSNLDLVLHPFFSSSSSASSSSSSSSSSATTTTTTTTTTTIPPDRAAFRATTVDVSLDHINSYSANSDLLLTDLAGPRRPHPSRLDLPVATNTPVAAGPRFDLADGAVMAYIRGPQQRRCTLCLDPLRDPAATQCGHVFCWLCIADWVREKPECPLCRREAMVQHILPLRVM